MSVKAGPTGGGEPPLVGSPRGMCGILAVTHFIAARHGVLRAWLSLHL